MTLANLASPPPLGLFGWENGLLIVLTGVVLFLTRCKLFKPWLSPILACAPFIFTAGLVIAMAHPWGATTVSATLAIPIYIFLIFIYGLSNYKHPQPLNHAVGYLFTTMGGLGLLMLFCIFVAGCMGPVIAVLVGLLAIAGAPIAFWQYKKKQKAKVFRQTYHCHYCDYDLRGTLDAKHCSECGHEVSLDPEKLKLVFPEDD